MKELIVVTSIDTEEDDWTPQRGRVTLSNIRALPRLQPYLDQFGVRVTYFVTYKVATELRSAEIVRELHQSGRAEIGAHLHPWNTPPMMEAPVDRNTMLSNLAPELQEQKLRTLTDTLSELLGRAPNAFRAGRYGFGPGTVRALLRCGYSVDSSVTPYVNWTHVSDGPDYCGAPVDVYRLGTDTVDVRVPSPHGALVEVPESGGFTRRPFALWARIDGLLRRPVFRELHLLGLAARCGLMNRVRLSPETDSVEDMVRLSRCLHEQGTRFVHWSWHSPSLRPGLSPFVRSARDVEHLYGKIEAYLERLASFASLRFATVTEAAALLAPAVVSIPKPASLARHERTAIVEPATR